jgi:hypothetical protein
MPPPPPPAQPTKPPNGPPPTVSPHAAAPDEPISGFPAYGTLIQVLSSGLGVTPEVYTTIEGVGDITGPTNQCAEVDVTSHSTGVPIKQVIPGLIDVGDISFPCYWNPDDPTQNINSPFGMEYLFFNRITTKFQLINTNPTHRTRQFKGWVKTLTEDAKVTGVMQRTIAIRITTPFIDVPSAISITPQGISAPATGAPSGTFTVQTGGSNTPWNAIASDPWIQITSPTGLQVGDGPVTYTIANNPTTPTTRTGTITITGLGLVFTVNQA